MATLFQRGRIWYVNYSLNGRQHRLSTGTSSRKLATVMLADLEVKLFTGKLSPGAVGRDVSVEEVFTRHLESLSSYVVPEYLSHVRRHLALWLDYLSLTGIIEVERISPAAVDEFMATKLEGRSVKTKKEYITSLQAALNRSVSAGLIRSNPVRGVKVRGKVTRKVRFLTEEEVSRLLNCAPKDLRVATLILVNTGMRLGELWALRWKDIDFGNRQFWVRAYDGFIPKGRKDRSIPMNDRVLSTVLELASVREDGQDYVYRLTCNKKRLSNKFGRFVRKLGINARLHDLRHTFASHLAMKGTPIQVIQELLGHSQVTTTMIYAHLSPNIHRKEIDKLSF